MRRRNRHLADLEKDILDHIDPETQENVDRGMPPEEARRAARLKFGNAGLVMEETRAVWTAVWLEQCFQDVRYAIRTFRRWFQSDPSVIGKAVGLSDRQQTIIGVLLFRTGFPAAGLYRRGPAAGAIGSGR